MHPGGKCTSGDEVGALQANVLQVLVGSDGGHEVPGPHLPQGVVVQHQPLHHGVVLQSPTQHHTCRRPHARSAHVQLLPYNSTTVSELTLDTALSCWVISEHEWANLPMHGAPGTVRSSQASLPQHNSNIDANSAVRAA